MFRVSLFDEVPSTNDIVKRALEAGEPEGFAVAARMQTGGYGRQGRRWASPEGGMYVSCLLRPQVPAVQLPSLSLTAALAVRRAVVWLAPQLAARLKVKWPNDLLVCGIVVDGQGAAEDGNACAGVPLRKLCGISLEAHAGGVCVGIGVNVLMPSSSDAAEPIVGAAAKNVPVYLEELASPALSVEQVRVAVLDEFSTLYAAWRDRGFSHLLAEYEACSYLVGRQVRVENLDGSLVAQGIVCGTDEHAHLLVLPAEGATPVAVSSGEVHIVACS